MILLPLLALLLQDPAAGDPSHIRFRFAGEFEEAVRISRETNRMLLVKGVSLILDEEAARLPNRGQC